MTEEEREDRLNNALDAMKSGEDTPATGDQELDALLRMSSKLRDMPRPEFKDRLRAEVAPKPAGWRGFAAGWFPRITTPRVKLAVAGASFASGAAAVLLVVFLMGVFGSDDQRQVRVPIDQDNVQAAKSQAEPRYVEVSWAVGYRTLASLASASVAIIDGTVTGLARKTVDRHTVGDLEASLLFSDYEFEVASILKGNVVQDKIMIHQTGGTTDGFTVEVRDDPLLEVGARYILFLRSDGELFVTLGGPAGRLVVENGLVKSLSEAYPERGITSDLQIKEVPVEDFLAEIERILEIG